MFYQLGRFIIFSNIFIACCAVLMLNQSFQLLLHSSADFHLIGFVFFSTICSYSFHWQLSTHSPNASERFLWKKKHKQVHNFLFCVGLIGACFFFYYLLPHWPWLLVGAVATFLYSAPKIPNKYFRLLRKIALGKTIFLAFVWMYVTTVLPVAVSNKEWDSGIIIFCISRFFFIYAICILFDYRDRVDDKAAGIRSLITYFNEKGIAIIFIVSLLLFAIATILLFNHDFSLTSIIFLLVPGIITAGLYNYARTNFSDILYYFVLDGLMAFSALPMLIFGI